jgi:membrane associated rhomboid family serine protease
MRITFDAKVTLAITGICLLAYFLLHSFLNQVSGLFVLNGRYQQESVSWYLSTVMYIFGHADLQHLFGNLSFFLVLSPIVEKVYEVKKYLLMIVTAAIFTAIIHTLFWENGLMGLSGIVFMLIILSTLIHAKANEIPFTFILVLLFYFSQEVYLSFSKDNVSHMAHLAGGISGIFWGYFKR